MNVSLEKTDDVTAKLTVKLEKVDYEANVANALKKMKQRVNMPGFRPGMVPMSLVKKMYGAEAKAEEVNKALSNAVNNYIKDEKLHLLTDPMISEDQQELDLVNGDDFEFLFDLGIAPIINVELTAKDKIEYFDIQVDDKAVEDQVGNYCRQTGNSITVDAYEQEDDLLRGALVELNADGTEKEEGLKVEKVSLMPKYFSNDSQKEIFKNAQKDSDVTFNISQAYDGKDAEIASILKVQKEDVAKYTGDFKFHVDEVTRFVPAELNQEMFNSVFGPDTVKSEDEFRQKIKADMEDAYVRDSDYKLLLDVRTYVMDKAGDVQFPEPILKRFLLNNIKKEEDKQNIDNLLKDYVQELKWNLVRTQLAESMKVKIDDAALKDTAAEMIKIQFSQYGINHIPEETLTQYADGMLKDEKQRDNIINRTIDRALITALKAVISLDHKATTIEDFNKMFESVA